LALAKEILKQRLEVNFDGSKECNKEEAHGHVSPRRICSQAG
jgi:hypothetical protein